ncbi:hypothetical protein [Mycobacterium sp.]|uniref:hypothetical protein n=1 Tax=Mycobacterium sp. TaxID=1785 RepID=UPI00261540E4|nr:hypothetical protein [Mycobacterium sp.]
MNQDGPPITASFPQPSPLLIGLLDDLRLAAERPPETREELRWLADLPRPWDPPTCPATLQQQLWRWLDDVAAWINEEHTWRVDRLIPICWIQHPHIAHEIATLACQRHNATYAVTPDALEDWHRYALPAFLDRITQRIGATGCPPDKHQSCPGAARHARHRDRLGSVAKGHPD